MEEEDRGEPANPGSPGKRTWMDKAGGFSQDWDWQWHVKHMVTGQLADTPTRGLDISRTKQVEDWTTRITYRIVVFKYARRNINKWLNNNIQLHFIMKHFKMTQWRVLCPHNHLLKHYNYYRRYPWVVQSASCLVCELSCASCLVRKLTSPRAGVSASCPVTKHITNRLKLWNSLYVSLYMYNHFPRLDGSAGKIASVFLQAKCRPR